MATVSWGQGSYSLFVDDSTTSLKALDLKDLIQDQHPQLLLQGLEISSLRVYASGDGALALDLGVGAAKPKEFRHGLYLDIVDLPLPQQRAEALWQLWMSGRIYVESVDITLRTPTLVPLPEQVSCQGVMGQVRFVISKPAADYPTVEVIGRPDFVWVITGFGDRHIGPWLSSYPNRSNFTGNATHWRDSGGTNHWRYRVQRTYQSYKGSPGRIYFMANAWDDNPYLGQIVDWCDPFL